MAMVRAVARCEVVVDPGQARRGVAALQGGEQRFEAQREARGAELVELGAQGVPLFEQQEVADDLQAAADLGLVDGRVCLDRACAGGHRRR